MPATRRSVMPLVGPYLTVSDGVAAIDFYKKAFGAKEHGRMPSEDGRRLMHASLEINGDTVMLSDEFPEMGDSGTASPKKLGGTTVTIHIHLTKPSEVDATYKRALDAGAEAIFPPADMFWGDRFAKLRDPVGHVWSLGAEIPK